MLKAQTDLLLPAYPEDSFDQHPNIKNTGAASTEDLNPPNDEYLYVMTWDGDRPGFGWYHNGNSNTGTQLLDGGTSIQDPDVVIRKSLSTKEIYKTLTKSRVSLLLCLSGMTGLPAHPLKNIFL